MKNKTDKFIKIAKVEFLPLFVREKDVKNILDNGNFSIDFNIYLLENHYTVSIRENSVTIDDYIHEQTTVLSIDKEKSTDLLIITLPHENLIYRFYQTPNEFFINKYDVNKEICKRDEKIILKFESEF